MSSNIAISLIILVIFTDYVVCQADKAFYMGQQAAGMPQFQFADAPQARAEKYPDVDAHRIIGPMISPFMDIFDQMQENARAKSHAEKIRKDRDDHPLSTSKSLWEMFQRLQQPSTTTTPQPPLIERLLKPYIEPWQKQLDDFSKDMAGITLIPTSTTTTPRPTTTTTQNILEKSLSVFFPSLRRKPIQEPPTTTTASTPRLFDAEMFQRILFNRDKRHSDPRPKRQAPPSGGLPNLFTVPPPPPIFPEWERPILDVANPFTPNSFMKMFTTPATTPLPEVPKIPDPLIHDPKTLPIMKESPFKLQDPFYNPLFPNRKSKLFDFLAGGEASRLLG